MQDNDIDYQKDYLIIFKDVDGHFRSHRWYKADYSPEQVQERIAARNTSQDIGNPSALFGELVTDQLVREICAYKKQAEPLEDILREVKELQGNINSAKKYLESAMENLNRMEAEE